MRWMLTGPSSATRVSHQRAMSSAWPLGVGRGELAAGVAGAGDEAGADRDCAWWREPSASIAACAASTLFGGDAGDQQILPDRETDIAVAEFTRDLGKPAHLRGGDLADRQHHADPVEAVLLLRDATPIWARRSKAGRGAMALGRRARRACGRASPRRAARNFSKPQAVEHVFQPRLGAVGAVAVVDEHAHHGVGDLGRLGGLDDHAGIAGEILVAGDAAEA